MWYLRRLTTLRADTAYYKVSFTCNRRQTWLAVLMAVYALSLPEQSAEGRCLDPKRRRRCREAVENRVLKSFVVRIPY
jgi:hypothetical protein